MNGTHLMRLRPLPDCVVVLALVPRVEVGECSGGGRVVPHLAEDARVDVAHEGLADCVEAVGWMGKSQSLLRERKG